MSPNDVPSTHPFGIGERQYTGDPAIRDNLAKELAELHKNNVFHDDFFSPEEEKEVEYLIKKKVRSIENLPARHQYRMRRLLNEERKRLNKPEIQRDDINPMSNSYKEKYAKLIVDHYNMEIDNAINSLYDNKMYEKELQNLEHCTKKQLQQKVKKIPTDVKSEIVHALQLHPQSITAWKKEVQKKIIATFNAYY